MTTKVFQQIATRFNGFINIETGHRTSRTGSYIAGTGQDHRRTIIFFRQTRGHDTDDALMPFFVVHHDTLAFFQILARLQNTGSFFGDILIEVFTSLVVGIDFHSHFLGQFDIVGHEQIHCFGSRMDTTRSIQTRTNLEHDIADGDFLVVQIANMDNGFQPHAGIGIELLESVISQNTVFVGDGHNIGSNAHSHQIEQRNKLRERNLVVLRKSLHQFKANPATRQIVVRIGGIGTLGIQHGHRIGQFVIGFVMVADDEVYTFLFGISNFLHRLDTAVEHNHQRKMVVGSKVDALIRNAVTFHIAVGQIIVQISGILAQKAIN